MFISCATIRSIVEMNDRVVGFALPEDFRELDPFIVQELLQLRLIPLEAATIEVQTARVVWPWVSDCRRNQRRIRDYELPTLRSSSSMTGARGPAIVFRRSSRRPHRRRRWRRSRRRLRVGPRSAGPHWPVCPQKVDRYGILLHTSPFIFGLSRRPRHSSVSGRSIIHRYAAQEWVKD
jgi:hypothetical protein